MYPVTLTANQRKVFDILEHADAPLGAYAIQGQIGFRTPVQVYRALETLMHLGLVKKLESLHAYIRVSPEEETEPTAFTICDHCGHIHQLTQPREVSQLHEFLALMNFEVGRSVIEIHGACPTCASRKQNDE